ncbi:MAG: CRISPR-associated helicase Cas3' [Thermanaeromonas sp.]|uniref:CRISPR-associated helicase Cas3' n=1 Tax=Thermanaeromonas sp. TaxID=2003697 RepID=UPI00243D923B|nr:CRISPR-associated helicase Cas3' [Thermanaeromonas sp.]MCG0278824.1 CRISPR-associated helicase Cas3' [Thermanaeromonas sp.]
MGYYAHKDGQRRYRLSSHLALVAARAGRQVSEASGREGLYPVAVIVGLAHDFGKYTSYFQDYLITGVSNNYKEHAFLSALWAVHLGAKQGFSHELRLLSFLAVIWHHRDLGDPEKYILPQRKIEEDWAFLEVEDRRRLEVAQTQVEDLVRRKDQVVRSLKCTARRAAYFLARQGLDTSFLTGLDWEELLDTFFCNWKEIYASLFPFLKQYLRRALDLSLYFSLLRIFGALIDADKLHAGRIRDMGREALPVEAVEIYKKACFKEPHDPINLLREEVYRNAATRISRFFMEYPYFTLTAPTGSGKTLAAFNASLLLRQHLEEMKGILPRIIYALPFTSIIDQNHNVFTEVLKKAIPDFISRPSPYLLKHHHLADVFYRATEEEDLGFDEAILLIESWQSEIIITTFVQLLHTLIGYRNRMLKKFNRLNHAIVIMDEVQNIPVEYWPLVATVLKEAAKELDLRLILMTATRPEWFSPGEALELAGEQEDVARFFKALNRVKLYPDLKPRTVAEAAELFLSFYEPSKSYLVVLNTICSSIEFYNYVGAHLKSRAPLFYLSTNIIPAERERRLEELKKLLEQGVKPVLVSTQVVEAGVDLDFDEVWRDIGPIDAIVQVAGRCNRHSRKKKGVVRLVKLVDEKGNALACRVYGNIHVWGAEKVFEHRSRVEEPDFFEAVADFFQFVRERKDTSKSEGILQAMKGLRFQRDREEADYAVRDFRLIEDRPDQVEVFVAVDEEAEGIWQRYREEVVGAPDIKSRQEAYYKIKRDFGRYMVSVPAKILLGKVDETVKPLYIPRYLVPEVYDLETGFKRVEEGMFIV